ncbi:uncharacterized protein MYCFIDRAFT_178707 [Pseudocercospora fijiensis CIRAD86]|uniref:Uncharacterized protein n=1 Tax=Pseudocercospora fijiensis (strain CIRAD86) TaxID=383855 RepID=M2YLG1_PSEFD|nr:uncharacterized protein MYCFIDRAFT_178707 [Pseudocercospora fijiensis CIRAD86]EME78580.1 hypothetical protein MYCFIDRAFT_178707 [Pseudocercospora fijiensis CIRAD86]
MSLPSYEQTFHALSHTRMDWQGESGLTHWIPPVPSIFCPNPFPSPLPHPLDGEGLQGQIAFLPRQEQIPHTSIIHPQLNKGAYSHPCVILATSPCTSYVFCAPITSFNGQALQEKMARATDKSALWQYLQIQHFGAQRDPPNELGELQLVGEQMAKPSYVNLKNGFWIEWRYLGKFNPRANGRIALAPESYLTATWAYAVAEQHRQLITASIACPVACTPARPATPPLSVEESLQQIPYMGTTYYPIPAAYPPSPPLEGLNAAAPEFSMPTCTGLDPTAANFTFEFVQPEVLVPIYAPVPVQMPWMDVNAWSYSQPPVMAM